LLSILAPFKNGRKLVGWNPKKVGQKKIFVFQNEKNLKNKKFLKIGFKSFLWCINKFLGKIKMTSLFKRKIGGFPI